MKGNLQPSDLPIGVFDSGVGGLTVAAALRRQLPAEDLIYLGDTARVPYGTRSAGTVQRYSHRVAGHLFRRGIKALVVACNTATTWALPSLVSAGRRLNVPVIGVIEPGVKRALELTRSEHVGVIGTEGTVRGGAYVEAFRAHAPNVVVSLRACPLFVALAEEGWGDGDVAALVAEKYLGELRNGPDVLVLGCTHYPLLREAIQRALPGVTLVDSAEAVAAAVRVELGKHGLLKSTGAGSLSCLVTDHTERFTTVGSHFLVEEPSSVELVDLDEADGLAFPVHPAEERPL